MFKGDGFGAQGFKILGLMSKVRGRGSAYKVER